MNRVKAVFKKILGKTAVEYRGNFSTWEAATKSAGSYSDQAIFEKVKEARKKVERGEAAYERDGVTFPSVPIFYPVLASLFRAASYHGNSLNLLDFGVSLGTSYYQHKEWLSHTRVRWNIVEQKHFVEFGRNALHDSAIHFYDSFERCMSDAQPKVFFISSALQYMPKPYALLEKVKAADFTHLIFDRTTVLEDKPDRITIQNVPKKIYPQTSFPAWLFNERKLCSFFAPSYTPIFQFPSIGDPVLLDDGTGRNKGYCFERVSA